jgi:hypothetical protein
MSKVTIAGDAVVITSSMEAAVLKALTKFKPSAVKLVDEKSKEELFSIGFGTSASETKHGVVFTGVDAEGNATVTLSTPTGMNAEDKLTFVRDTFGAAILNLNKLETKLAGEIQEFNAAMAEVESSITTVI